MSIYQGEVILNMGSYCSRMNDSDDDEVTDNIGSNCYKTQRELEEALKSSLCIGYVFGDKVTLTLGKGDQTSFQDTDTIVNFVYEDNVFGTMGILDKAGDEIKQQYETRCFQDQTSDVIMTAAGNLPYKAIFHVEVVQNSAKFENAIYNTLRLADKQGLRSIAFPALEDTTHINSYLKVFYEFESRAHPACLHMIDIHVISHHIEIHEYHENEMSKRGGMSRPI